MHLRPARTALPAAAIITCLAALVPASADAAKPKRSDWLYDVTVRVQMSEEWRFHEEAHMGDAIDPCDRYQDGEGAASIQLRSRRPTRVMVLRGMRGHAPNLDVGTGEGIPLVGSYDRSGKDETHHTGVCAAGNPPHKLPTEDCGPRQMKANWTLAYKSKRTVAPVMPLDDLRANCPSGPMHSVEWEKDAAPQLGEVTTTVSPSRFYGTKQFTVRGQRTFKGVVPSMNEPHFGRFGHHEVTWQWETTYRLVGKKQQRRKRR